MAKEAYPYLLWCGLAAALLAPAALWWPPAWGLVAVVGLVAAFVAYFFFVTRSARFRQAAILSSRRPTGASPAWLR